MKRFPLSVVIATSFIAFTATVAVAEPAPTAAQAAAEPGTKVAVIGARDGSVDRFMEAAASVLLPESDEVTDDSGEALGHVDYSAGAGRVRLVKLPGAALFASLDGRTGFGKGIVGAVVVADGARRSTSELVEPIAFARLAGIEHFVIFVDGADSADTAQFAIQVQDLVADYVKTPAAGIKIVEGAAQAAIDGSPQWEEKIRSLRDAVQQSIVDAKTAAATPAAGAENQGAFEAEMVMLSAGESSHLTEVVGDCGAGKFVFGTEDQPEGQLDTRTTDQKLVPLGIPIKVTLNKGAPLTSGSRFIYCMNRRSGGRTIGVGQVTAIVKTPQAALKGAGEGAEPATTVQ